VAETWKAETMSDIKAMISKARRPETTVTLHLDTGLVEEFEQTEKLLEAEQAKPTNSLEGNPEARRLAERLDELGEQMQASRLEFRLRALSPRRWVALREEHPPRRGDDGEILPRDRHLGGVNLDDFSEALLRLCVISPELDDDDWAALLGDDGVLTDGQYNMLASAAIRLNESDVDIPFSLAASKTLASAPE
jgi:hypothetical protein